MSAPGTDIDHDQPKGAMAELKAIYAYAGAERPLLISTFALSALLAVVDIPIPFFLKHVLDATLRGHTEAMASGNPPDPKRMLTYVFVCLLLLALAKGVLTYARRVTSETLGQRVIYSLRLDLYRHLQSLSMTFFRSASTGKLMLRLMGDVQAVLRMVTAGFLRVVTDSICIVVLMTVLLLMHWKLALLVFSGLPIYAAALLRLSPQLRKTGRRARRERSVLSGTLQETISGAEVIKSFNQQDTESRRLAAQTTRLKRHLIKRARIAGKLTAITHVTVAVGGALVLWIGGNAVLSGQMTKGGLIAFYTLAAMLFPPLRRLARTNETYQAARVSLDRILDFLERTEPLLEHPGCHDLIVTRGAIKFENVTFEYVPGEAALSEVNLEIRPGESVALVGPNGAGKTTLACLLARFIEPTSGRVLIDGQDLSQATVSSLRNQLGIVTQRTFLFSGTVADNIRYGRQEASDEELRDAALAANALDFIEALPDGFDTEVGERGQRLSGGEAQRIALARMLLADPPILVLDEATSAVDTESEEAIQQAIERLMRGRTTVVIAHRKTTISKADRVVVLDRGRLVEDGSHEMLIGRQGIYSRLFTEQINLRGKAS